MSDAPTHLSRRSMLGMSAGAVFVTAMPLRASATVEDVLTAQRDLFGDTPIQEGRVALKLPPIAENGYSVPLQVEVDSPMTDEDYVKRIAVFAARNPLPLIAQYHLGPQSGRARIETRIRMGGTQAITVVAEMNDGSLWSGSAETVVTLAACVVL